MVEFAHSELFWLGAAGMTLGTLVFLRAFVVDASNRIYHALLVGVSGVAAAAYALMALGVGLVASGSGDPLFVTRYADWLVTTPLLILYLGLLAGISRRAIAGLIALDVVMIAAGLAAVLSSGLVRYGLFVVGMAAFVPMVYGLVVGIRQAVATRPPAIRALFGKLRNLTVVVWSIYPVVWLIGPAGVGLIGSPMEVLIVTYTDLIAKVGFGIIALSSQQALSELTQIDTMSKITFGG